LPAPAKASHEGLAALLEALDRWCSSPSPAARRRIAVSLRRLAEAWGLAGIYLQVTHPLPALSVGTGSLKGRPAGRRFRGNALSRRSLRAGDPPRQVGMLAVAAVPADSPPSGTTALASGLAETAETLGSLLEMALRGALTRAEAQATAARLEALDEATRAIAGVLSTERVLQLIVDSVRRLAGAQYAALGIVDGNRRMDPFITSGMSRAARERIGAPPRGRGLLGAILEGGAPIRVDNIGADPRHVGFPPGHPTMRTFLGVPITVRGRVLGNLYLTDRTDGHPFSEDDQRLVELFASHAGIAIENARLHEQEQRLAILEERQRIGRDLHDGIIQSIYAAGLTLDDASDLLAENPSLAQARIEQAAESLNLTIRDLRNFIFALQPEPFDQGGLVDALTAMAEEFRVNTTVDIGLEISGWGHTELSADATLQLLNLTREALSNVSRHARARRAELRLSVTDSVLELLVADDGIGFDPSARRGPGHMGINNMRARAADLNAEFFVESAAGRGTRVVVRVPLPNVVSAPGVPPSKSSDST
jgi:signal transduction histidine kinase